MLPAAASQRRGEHVAPRLQPPIGPVCFRFENAPTLPMLRFKIQLRAFLSLFFSSLSLRCETGGKKNPLLLLRGHEDDPLFRKMNVSSSS